MSHQSPRCWLRLTLVALFALTLLGTFPTAKVSAIEETSVHSLQGSTSGPIIYFSGILQENAWLRYWPSTSAGVMRTVHAGHRFTVSATSGSWCQGSSDEAPFDIGWIPCYHIAA
jgi:hypothetical protein